MVDIQQFKGTGTALVTPFTKDGAIDYDSLKRLIEFNIEGGVDYLVCLGTTGEAVTLNRPDCQAILDFTVEVVAERVPIVFGVFGSNSTEIVLERLTGYSLDGVSALLSASPYYNKPSQEGIFQHYKVFDEQSPLPIIIYNVPGRTASNISAETTLRIAKECKNIIGIKEASGNSDQIASILKHRPDDFLVLSGDDPTVLGSMAYGADGVISVVSNVYPDIWSKMIRSCLNGDFAEARKFNAELIDLHQWLYIEGNPCGIKAALQYRGIIKERHVRLPLVPLSEANYASLKREMDLVKG
ncbi:4-hydroxy-tetrahydrodipicolinate synthase [Membranihabitans marinus]|uniref:4-hydroxy-tetrahydrodipicolinate synthase n=1 Tax=Membranihabitans marinus TaxID=1227546 RepID=UPI001F02E01D|nr:4-hydroxy-tetrahydrodipicolinate synthase [Membranihabitans marinus]